MNRFVLAALLLSLPSASLAQEFLFRADGASLSASVVPEEDEGPPALEQRRYWRVLAGRTVGGSEMRVAEADFRVGGASVASGGSPLSSTPVNSLYGASKLFDGATSKWDYFQPASLPGHFGYDFGTEVLPETVHVWAYETFAPQELEIQWSDDGEEWTTSAVYRGQGAWNGERVFPVQPISYPSDHYRFYRLDVLAASGRPDYPGEIYARSAVMEVEFTGGGVNLARDGIASATSFDGFRDASRAFDGDRTSTDLTWRSTGLPASLTYEFPKPVKADSVVVTGNGPEAPKDFDVSVSANGDVWTKVLEARGNGGWSRSSRTFPLGAGAYPSDHRRFWRVNVTATRDAQSSTVAVQEIQFQSDGVILDTVQGSPFGTPGMNASFAVSRAFDTISGSNSSGLWQADSKPAYIGYEFRHPVRPDVVFVWASNDGLSGNFHRKDSAPMDFTVESSADGKTWTVESEHRGYVDWGVMGSVRAFPIED